MSLTVSTIADPLGSKLVIDDDSDATPEQDVTGSSSTVVYSVTVDNSANTTVPTYTKLSASGNAVTAGTTAPEDQVRVAAGVKETYIIGTGTAFAHLSFWSVISPYALNGDDDNADVGPASKVTVKILCT